MGWRLSWVACSGVGEQYDRTTTAAAAMHPQVLEKLEKRKHSDDDIPRVLMLEILQGRPGGNTNFALRVMKGISGVPRSIGNGQNSSPI